MNRQISIFATMTIAPLSLAGLLAVGGCEPQTEGEVTEAESPEEQGESPNAAATPTADGRATATAPGRSPAQRQPSEEIPSAVLEVVSHPRLHCATEARWIAQWSTHVAWRLTAMDECYARGVNAELGLAHTDSKDVSALEFFSNQEFPALNFMHDGHWNADGVDLTSEGFALDAAPVDGTVGVFEGVLTIQGEEFAAACWTDEALVAFQYDPSTGHCTNDAGESGRVALPLAFVRETRRGQCADLSGLSLNEENYNYPKLANWDLRGADLRDAALHFAELPDAQLEGVLADSFTFGYAEITGSVDAHSQLPFVDDACHVSANAVNCLR